MDEPHFTQRIIKPKDCALCFGIPTSKEGFFHRENREHSVARQSMTAADRYLEALKEVMPGFAKHGVQLVPDLTLEKFRAVLNQKYQVVILFSHWMEQGEAQFIEFEDGFVSVEKVAAAIPGTFSGVLDLSVCTADKLGEMLANKFEDQALVMCSSEEVIFEYWLHFYALLFRKLEEEEEIRYSDAYCQLIEILAEKFYQHERRNPPRA